MGRDVTGKRKDGARAELENRLRASEARWRAVVESAVDAIIVIRADGRIETVNPATVSLFGYTEDELRGRNINLLMPEPFGSEHDGYLSRYLSTGTKRIIGIGREVAGLHKDGTVFPVHLSVGEITVAGERRFTGILRDLSARVRVEHQLREQATLARIGEMAAVLAHEVKNPLAGIRAAVQLVHADMPAENVHAPMLKDVIKRIDTLDQLMKDLLMYARPPEPRRGPVELASLLAATATFAKHDPALTNVRIEINGVKPVVVADPEMLRIVFHNLLVNGAHAMKGAGTIRVGIRTVESDCEIAFTDEGPGIPVEIRDKIFAPFFTTKAAGTGLGLPIAKRMIDAHLGQISVDCPPAGGTTILVRLPSGES